MSLLSFRSTRCLFRRGLAPLSAFALIPTVQAQPANVHLQGNARGSAAIAALGAHLPAVAKAYGLEAQGLVSLLQTQPSLGVDQAGALLFACDGLTVDARALHSHPNQALGANAMTATSSTTTLLAGATVDAFQLHSFPGATRVIFLDFSGHTTSGTSWNTSYTAGAPIVSQPFDLDGDSTTFNATERAMIQAIWKRVSEDYAPFAIDVTTQDPGIEALRKTSATDNTYGIRAVISPTNWYNSSAGGVGYVGSFSWDSDTPCFAFTAQLANGEKYIAEAVSHEVGHTLGLYHDGLGGSSPTEYYAGQGNWAPIMGVSYYQPVTQFSKGEYPNANNLQDDLAVIATYAPLATDDHGNTLATATLLTGPTVNSGGTIENRNDVDVFRFDTGAGNVSFAIQSPAIDPDLDIKAELLNASGQVLQTSNLATLDAALAATLDAGTYYIRISGIGSGDAATGYTNYGSLGNYVITGSIVSTGGKQAPVAVANASVISGTVPLIVAFSGQGSSDADGTIVSYSWNFGDGSTSTAMNPTYTYTSSGTFTATLTVTDNDGLVGTASVAISVAAPANQAPVAVASANLTSGSAPLPVAFSSAGSFDPDGTLASYLWDFGDGTTSTAASPTKTYSANGNYTARLTVTDNLGAKASSTVAISVAADRNTDIDVRQFTLTQTGTTSAATASAAIVVRDRLDRAVAGVTITVQWSGLVSGTSTGKTDATGRVVFTSRSTRKSGSITAKITALTPPTGTVYDSTIYSDPTSLSITLN